MAISLYKMLATECAESVDNLTAAGMKVRLVSDGQGNYQVSIACETWFERQGEPGELGQMFAPFEIVEEGRSLDRCYRMAAARVGMNLRVW